jgi:malate dehydrogenase (oxaloacetate-decarboxylating)(NADP+)
MDELSKEQAMFARSEGGGMNLQSIMETYKPTILLGLTAVGGLFTEDLITTMAKNCDRPILFPLSNPTTKAECTADQAYEWTEGRCIFASGSPFDPVEMPDGSFRTVSQCNNMFVFPGLGLGAALCGAKMVTDRMLYESARALAEFLSREDLASGQVFPPVSQIREVSHKVAMAVIREADRTGLQTKLSQKELDNLDEFVRSKMYDPVYVPLVEKRTVTI